MAILKRDFYSRDTIKVAKDLLGKFLYKDGLVGKIVETEAYIGTEDKACHARWRKRETCAPMWGPPGFSYVYFTYGMYHMLNIVTEKEGFPAAVLIRALEPIRGIKKMVKNRGFKSSTVILSLSQNLANLFTDKIPESPPEKMPKSPPRRDPALRWQVQHDMVRDDMINLTSGPGKLTKALNITKDLNNTDLTKSKDFYIYSDSKKETFEIVTSTRIGIRYAEEYKHKPWRFYIKENPFISKPGLKGVYSGRSS